MSKYKVGRGKHLVEQVFHESLNDKRSPETYRKVWRRVRTSLCDLEGYTPPEKKDLTFTWPEYTTETKRIRANTNKLRELSITDAFAKALGIEIRVGDDFKVVVDNVPSDLRVGDVIDVSIKSISRDSVEFDCVNLKQTLYSNIKLGKYTNFQRFTPKGTIKAKVVSSTPQKVIIDPIAPMLDEFINPIVADPTLQKVMDREVTPITVKNLKITRGGYIGKAVIPNVSSWVGEDYTVDAFIPGSQIVLNIENDFNRWNGKTVNAFISNYVSKPSPNGKPKMSLVCSVKERLKFEGEKQLIDAFKIWCEDKEKWDKMAAEVHEGVVTGVIHTSKKCGVFIEVPSLNITGFVPAPPDKIVNYKPYDKISVNWVGIDENTYYDEVTKQTTHRDPFVIENGVLKKCYIKPMFKFVE